MSSVLIASWNVGSTIGHSAVNERKATSRCRIAIALVVLTVVTLCVFCTSASTAQAHVYQQSYTKGLRTVMPNLADLGWDYQGVMLFNSPGAFYMGRLWPGDKFRVDKEALGEHAPGNPHVHVDGQDNFNFIYRFGKPETVGGNVCLWLGPRSRTVPSGDKEYFSPGAEAAPGACNPKSIKALASGLKQFTNGELNCSTTGNTNASGPTQTWLREATEFYFNVDWDVSGEDEEQRYTVDGPQANPPHRGSISLLRNHKVEYRFTSGQWAVVYAEGYGWGFVRRATVHTVSHTVDNQTKNWGRWGDEGIGTNEAWCGSQIRNLPPTVPDVPNTAFASVKSNGSDVTNNGEIGHTGVDVVASSTHSAPDYVEYEYSIDGGGFALQAGGASVHFEFGEGWHTIRARARDGAVWDASPSEIRFYVDVTPPETTVVSGPEDNTVVFAAGQWFGFVSSDRGVTTTTASFECRVNGEAWAACANPFWRNFTPGANVFEVRAVDTVAYVDPTPETRRFFVDPKSVSIGVNFGPSSANAVAGYVLDDGAPFGSKPGGYTMGWTAQTSAPVARGSSNATDVRYDSFISTQLNAASSPDDALTWEIEVPNGVYRVRVVAGDPSTTTNASYKYDVEGLRLLDGVPGPLYPWFESIRTISVSDGRLTVSNGAGALNNKLAFIEIIPASVGQHNTEVMTGPTEELPSTTATPEFTFASTETNVKYRCKIEGFALISSGGSLDFAECGQTFVTPSLPSGSYTLTVYAVDAANNVDQSPAKRTFGVAANAGAMKVDFKPSSGTVPSEFVADSGGMFGYRANGYTYGWLCDSPSSNYFALGDPISPSPQHDSFVELPSSCLGDNWPSFAGAWIAAVPNGAYDVKIVAGGPAWADSRYVFNVEHVPTIDFTPNSGNRWIERTRKVVVTDGLLSITSDARASHNRLAFLEITPSTVAQVDTSILSGPSEGAVVSTASPTFSFASTVASSQFRCELEGFGLPDPEYVPCGQTYTTPTLPSGQYTLSVYAVDPEQNIDQSPVVRHFGVAGGTAALKVNFQPDGSPVPSGFVADTGGFFGNRANGYTYGWLCSPSPGDFVDADDPTSPNQQHDTSVRVPAGCDSMPFGAWIAAVPNGTYDVKVVAGGATNWSGLHYKFNVDGVQILDGSPSAANRWIDGTRRIVVDDGLIGVTQATGVTDGKLAYIEITPSSSPQIDTLIISGPAESGTAKSSTPTFTFGATESGATFRCKLNGIAHSSDYAPCGQTFTTPTLSNGEYTLSVYAVGSEQSIDQSPEVRKFSVAGNRTTVRVNFQPSGVVPPSGYVADSGGRFGDRGNGYAYGWFCPSNASNFRDADSSRSPDERYDTYVDFGSWRCGDYGATIASIGAWALAVPNGEYVVRVVAGAPGASGNYELDVEGVRIVDGTTGEDSPWIDQTRTIEVSDGLLSLTQGRGGTDGRVAFIEVIPASDAASTSINFPESGAVVAASTVPVSFATAQFVATTCSIDTAPATTCESPWTTQNLSNGWHTVRINSLANDGTTGERSVDFLVDTSPPETTITVGPQAGQPIADTTPGFEFESEQDATFECRVDVDEFASCTSPFATPELTGGGHVFEVRAVDRSGNADPTPASRTITVDTEPPVLIVQSPSPGATVNDGDLPVTFTADRPVIAECAFNDNAFAPCASGSALSLRGAGDQLLRVRAIAANGATTVVAVGLNVIVPAEAFIDGEELVVYGGSTAAAHDITVQPDGDLDYTNVVDAAADLPAFNGCSQVTPANVRCSTASVESVSIQTGGADDTITTASTLGSLIRPGEGDDEVAGGTGSDMIEGEGGGDVLVGGQGEDYLSGGDGNDVLRAVDGEIDTVDCGDGVDTVSIDELDVIEDGCETIDFAPDTSFISGPADGATSNSTFVTYGFESTENGSTFECSVDSAQFAPCANPFTTPAMTVGTHTIRVRAVDAGQTTDPSPAERTVHTVPAGPDTTITAGPVDGTTYADHDVEVEFTSSVPGSTFECKLDTLDWEECTSPWSVRFNNGSRTVQVRAKDPVGTYDPTPAQRTFTVNAPGYLEYWGAWDATGWGVDLTQYGTYDWAHWGLSSATSFNKKTPAASPGIVTYSKLGSGGTVTRAANSDTWTGWSNGLPTASSGGNNGSIKLGGALNRGFRVSIPASSANNRIVYVMFGALNTTAKLTTSITDGSFAAASDTPLTSTSTTTTGMEIAGFRGQSTSASATLRIDIQQNTSAGTGAVYLMAAMVADD